MSITRTDALSSIQLVDIIDISIVENRLKKNFDIIIQQLRLKSEGDNRRDDAIFSLKQEIKNMNLILQKQRFAENNQYVNIQVLNDMKDEILRQISNRNKSIQNEVEVKIHLNKKDLIQQLNLLKDQINNMNKEQKDLLEAIQKSFTLKLEDIKAKNPPSSAEGDMRNNKKSKKKDPNEDDINEKMKELKKQLLEYLNAQNKERDSMLLNHTREIWQMNEKLYNMQKLSDETKKQITQKQEQDRKNFGKWVQTKDLLLKVEGLQSNLRLIQNQLDSLERNIKDVEGEVHIINFNQSKVNINNQTLEEQQYNQNQVMKKQVLNKLIEQRKEYISLFKSLKENSNLTNQSSLKEKLREFQLMSSQLKNMLAKKADEETSKKAIMYLQKKINYTFNMFSGNLEGDARIAKTNWLCLSCDRNLTSYTGKIGEHIVHDAAKSKKPNFEYSTQKGVSLESTANMRYKSKSKVELPFVTAYQKNSNEK